MSASVRLASAIAFPGAALIVVGTFVPVNGGGDFGYRYAIFDRSLGQPTLLLVALQPLAVALSATLVMILLARRAPTLSAGLMIALGFQTLVFFAAYVFGAVFGSATYDSFAPGGVLGAVGAGFLLLAGLVLGTACARRRA